MSNAVDLMAAWQLLTEQTDNIVAKLGDASGQPFQSELAPAQFAQQALLDHWYYGDGDGRYSKNYYGHFHVSESIAADIKALNQTKGLFHQRLMGFKEKDRKALALQMTEYSRDRGINAMLHSQNISRLHVRQAYRQIPVFSEPVERIVFNWYRSGRSIKKLTKTEVLQMLMAYGPEQEHIKIQIDQLASHPDHQPLAQVQTQTAVLRANIRFASGERKAMNAPMPVFTCGPVPKVSFPSQDATEQPKVRQARSDQKVDSQVWLPSVRVHRYL